MKTDVLRLLGLPPEQVVGWVDRAIALRDDASQTSCAGRTLLLFFEKPSTRTRLSFQTAAHRLGAHSISMDPNVSQVARGEPLSDTAAMFGLFADAIAVRTSSHARVEELARYSHVPVINALTDDHHPCQILADVVTLRLKFGDLQGKKVAYIGDGNNITNSLAEAAAIFGFELHIATPEGYEIQHEFSEEVRATGAHIVESHDPGSAADGAVALYTDTWISMGQEGEKADKLEAFKGFQIDDVLMRRAAGNAIFLHCLPAYRGQEVSSSVIDGPQSAVLLQAENRLFAQMAILEDVFADVSKARVVP